MMNEPVHHAAGHLSQQRLLDVLLDNGGSASLTVSSNGMPDGKVRAPKKPTKPRVPRDAVRGIQDLLWKEGLFALGQVGTIADDAALQEFLRQNLSQNSVETRSRYAQSLMRWFFPDGIRGLAGSVWTSYHDQGLAAEVLRYLYLRAEPMVGATVAEALFPIAENSSVPVSYLTNFLLSRFGQSTPAKSIKRVKLNLRKLDVLAREKGNRDTLRALAPSATTFLIVLHHLFAGPEPGAVEFRTLAENPFWKYLGFKSEDQLRAILKDSVSKGLIAKYVLADRIESLSFRHTFQAFVTRRLRA